MSNNWNTEIEDMFVARKIIDHFAKDKSELGVFEFKRDESGQVTWVGLSSWVRVLIRFYYDRYGKQSGEEVVKKVVSQCIVNGQEVH